MIKSRRDCKCKDCTKRYVGCHSTCNDYKEFQEMLKKERQNTKVQNDYNAVVNSKKHFVDIRRKGKDK